MSYEGVSLPPLHTMNAGGSQLIGSDEQAAVDAALHRAKPGDLVVLFADALRRTWDQILDFKPDATALSPESSAPLVATLPDLPDLDIGEGQELIRDERGVRLAREIDD